MICLPPQRSTTKSLRARAWRSWKPSTTPYNDLKFAILKCIEEPKLEHSKWLLVQPVQCRAWKPPAIREILRGRNLLKRTAMIHPSQQSSQKWNLIQGNSDQITENSPKNFRSSLAIPTMNEERINGTNPSKHLPPTRDEPGKRRTHSNLKW